MTISIKQQIAELETELGMRLSHYPKRVMAGKMTKASMEFKIACIRAAIQSLKDKLYTGEIPEKQVVQKTLF